MPFEQPFPRPFTASAIQQFAPQRPGVYGLSNAREWLYIGTTPNIQSALMNHMSAGEPSSLPTRPTGFVFEVQNPSHQAARQATLILEYSPIGNQKRNQKL